MRQRGHTAPSATGLFERGSVVGLPAIAGNAPFLMMEAVLLATLI
jgi:hypothetical protein